MHNPEKSNTKPSTEKQISHINIDKFVERKTINDIERTKLIQQFYSEPVEKKVKRISGGDEEIQIWTNSEIITKIGKLDLSQKGFLLLDNFLDMPEMTDKGLRELFVFENTDQIKLTLKYLQQKGYDATGLLGAWAKRQRIIFEGWEYDYPVLANF